MTKNNFILTAILLICGFIMSSTPCFAVTDGTYNLSQVQTGWDGTDAIRTTNLTSDYKYSYGDEGSVTYVLPWPFTFYGQSYTNITADTNGNIWFSATGSAHSYSLANTGRGPVIAVWNNDLSSYYYGGVFVQHKTNPERVVIEWRTETYTDEGSYRPNRFEAVLYQNGSIRLDYYSFTPSTFKDFGSGISQGNGPKYISLTSSFGSPYSLSGRSFGVGQTTVPAIAIDPVSSPAASCTTLTGTMQVGSTVVITTNTGAIVGAISYPTPTTWVAGLCNLAAGDTVVTVTATSPTGQVAQSVTTVGDGSGGGGVPVPAIGPFGIVVAMFVLTIFALKGGWRVKKEL